MNRISSSVLCILICSLAWAQLEVDEPILLSSPNEEDRQVRGLADPIEATDAVNAASVLNARLIFDEASGTDQVQVELEPAVTAYAAGMILSFAPSDNNSGAVTISINGLPALPIVKNISEPLDSADLRSDVPVLVIYDGTVFQLIAQYSNSCPSGFLEMTRDYCIEAAPRAQANFWTASRICAQQGARLCSFGEWHYACRSAQGIFQSILDYEWVDHAANNVSNAKRIGVDPGGIPDCYGGGHSTTLTHHHYRCCYTK